MRTQHETRCRGNCAHRTYQHRRSSIEGYGRHRKLGVGHLAEVRKGCNTVAAGPLIREQSSVFPGWGLRQTGCSRGRYLIPAHRCAIPLACALINPYGAICWLDHSGAAVMHVPVASRLVSILHGHACKDGKSRHLTFWVGLLCAVGVRARKVGASQCAGCWE